MTAAAAPFEVDALDPTLYVRGIAHDVFRWMRENDPVHRDEKNDLWVVTKYDDISYVERQPDVFSSAQGVRPNGGGGGARLRLPVATRRPGQEMGEERGTKSSLDGLGRRRASTLPASGKKSARKQQEKNKQNAGWQGVDACAGFDGAAKHCSKRPGLPHQQQATAERSRDGQGEPRTAMAAEAGKDPGIVSVGVGGSHCCNLYQAQGEPLI